MRERILVVEDENEIANILTEFLHSVGYEVYVAYDGEEGLNIAIQHIPDVVLLDVNIPKMRSSHLKTVFWDTSLGV
jgi:DNA-binding response OmpR family regulator